nr:MAG TPA: hypothetical protein [Caudoviricetes sp.]
MNILGLEPYAPRRSDKGIRRKFIPFCFIINYLSLYYYYSALLQWVTT